MVETLRLKLKEQKGFTLIELLAVIVILGIIAAIAIPAISSVISKSQVKSQAQEGLQIINAARMYNANETPDDSLDKSQLMKYLDRVDATTNFNVTRDPAATGAKSYSLHDHPSTGTDEGNGKTEEQLLLDAK